MIGLRLRQLRQEQGISCRKMGKDMGLSASALSHYETGISKPSLENVLKIAEYFQVSIDYLTGRTEYRNYEDIQKQVKKIAAKQYINDLIDKDIALRKIKNK